MLPSVSGFYFDLPLIVTSPPSLQDLPRVLKAEVGIYLSLSLGDWYMTGDSLSPSTIKTQSREPKDGQPLALATTLDGLSPILEPTEWKERTAAHKCPHVPPTYYTKCDQREGQSSPSLVWFGVPEALGAGTRVPTVQTHLRTGHSLTTRAQPRCP